MKAHSSKTSLNLNGLIQQIVRRPALHARWLNTFSYLEYIGFRKIVKSQNADQVDSEILQHALEEGRHALRLKKLAVRLGGNDFQVYSARTLLCGDAAKAYFQNLDHACEAKLQYFDSRQRAQLVYYYVTWLVEMRALEVYGIYHQALGALPEAAVIKGLLTEEVGHLEEVSAQIQTLDPEFEKTQEALKIIEAQLYDNFLTALEHDLASYSPAESAHAPTLS